MKVEIHCDGSCIGNGNEISFGGFGLVIVVNGEEFKRFKKSFFTAKSGQMELEGVLMSAKMAKVLNYPTEIYCDSAYTVNTVNDWMYRWQANNWIKKTDKKPPENLTLVKELYELLNFNTNIKVFKDKGHAGHKWNEIAHNLAYAASHEAQREYLEALAKKTQ